MMDTTDSSENNSTIQQEYSADDSSSPQQQHRRHRLNSQHHQERQPKGYGCLYVPPPQTPPDLSDVENVAAAAVGSELPQAVTSAASRVRRSSKHSEHHQEGEEQHESVSIVEKQDPPPQSSPDLSELENAGLELHQHHPRHPSSSTRVAAAATKDRQFLKQKSSAAAAERRKKPKQKRIVSFEPDRERRNRVTFYEPQIPSDWSFYHSSELEMEFYASPKHQQHGRRRPGPFFDEIELFRPSDLSFSSDAEDFNNKSFRLPSKPFVFEKCGLRFTASELYEISKIPNVFQTGANFDQEQVVSSCHSPSQQSDCSIRSSHFGFGPYDGISYYAFDKPSQLFWNTNNNEQQSSYSQRNESHLAPYEGESEYCF